MNHALYILVVDDCAAVRKVLATVLGAAGHTVVLAEDVVEALGVLDAQRPDLILTDYRMPGLSGVELVREVRSRLWLTHIPIIVVSSEQAPETRSRMARAGANGWVAKPICATTLLGVVGAVAAGVSAAGGRPAGTLQADGAGADRYSYVCAGS